MPSSMPITTYPHYRGFLYLLACVGLEPFPGHLIFRGAFPAHTLETGAELKGRPDLLVAGHECGNWLCGK